jgi:hypothetical protein
MITSKKSGRGDNGVGVAEKIPASPPFVQEIE